MSLTAGPGFGAILLRGLLAGLIAGLLAGVVAYAAGEPRVDAAIAIEEANAPAAPAGDHDHDELVGRDGQKGGLFLATGLYGVAMGGLLAAAYLLLRRRLRVRDDGRAALALAGAALAGVVLVPFFKYPPNPPAVGDPSTINQRTISYLSLLVIGLVAVWAGVIAARSPRSEPWRAVAGVVAFLVVVAVGYVVLPAVDEVPATFPAGLLWTFRLSSLATQATLWTALGLGFSVLLTRRGAVRTAPEPVGEPVAG